VPADPAPAGTRVLVFGVGNPLMSDDGVGQRLLAALAARQPALDGVEYLDAGTLGFMLLPRIEQVAQAELVHAAARQPHELIEGLALQDAQFAGAFTEVRGVECQQGIALLDARQQHQAESATVDELDTFERRAARGQCLEQALAHAVVGHERITDADHQHARAGRRWVS